MEFGDNSRCDICSSGGVVYCFQCKKVFCYVCNRRHGACSLFDNHHCITVAGFSPDAITCSRHPDEKLECYCVECKQPFCCRCLLSEEHDHKIYPLPNIVQDFSRRLSDLETKLVQKTTKITEIKRSLVEYKERNSARRDQIVRQVKEQKQALREVLDREEQKLISRVNELFEKQQNDLDEKVNAMKAMSEKSKNYCEIVKSLNRPFSLIEKLKCEPDEIENLLETFNERVVVQQRTRNVNEWNPRFVKYEPQVMLGDVIEDDPGTNTGLPRRTYSREFLLGLKDSKKARIKPVGLPEIPEITTGDIEPLPERKEKQRKQNSNFMSEMEVKEYFVHFDVILAKARKKEEALNLLMQTEAYFHGAEL